MPQMVMQCMFKKNRILLLRTYNASKKHQAVKMVLHPH